jgi:2-(3-amino-3-carboxypropyl)histidine synthase
MTKVYYVPGKVKNAGIKELMKKVSIPGKFAITTTVQFLDEVKPLEEEGYTVIGQILGCNIVSVHREKEEFYAYLYIGTGLFHPLNLAFRVDRPVYILDPMTQEFYKLDEGYKDRYTRRKKGMLAKYYASKNIGIIVSTKSGQNNLNRAKYFKKKMGEKYPEKSFYLFMCNNVMNLEDFNTIECWVNTACIRIFEDDWKVPIVNIRDVDETNMP